MTTKAGGDSGWTSQVLLWWLMLAACGRYMTCPDLSFQVPADAAAHDLEGYVYGQAANHLMLKQGRRLGKGCLLTPANGGADVLRNMLRENCNREFLWPSVFGGGSERLPNFWLGTPPARHKWRLTLAPLRVVKVEAFRAVLCVDLRWMLLITSICGARPNQSSRMLMVSEWVRRFYEHCVPDSMLPSRSLYIGVPSPIMRGGFLYPTVRPSGRKTLRRPHGMPSMNRLAPVKTGLAEDMGPAATRLQLAAALKVDEKLLPTDCVSYSFPEGVWVPVGLQLSPQQVSRCQASVTHSSFIQ